MKSVREEIVEALEADAIIAGRIPHVAIVEKPTQHG